MYGSLPSAKAVETSPRPRPRPRVVRASRASKAPSAAVIMRLVLFGTIDLKGERNAESSVSDESESGLRFKIFKECWFRPMEPIEMILILSH